MRELLCWCITMVCIPMKANILDGLSLSNQMLLDLKSRIKQRLEKGKAAPGLAVILLGNNPASKIYVSRKHEKCLSVGLKSEQYQLPEDTTEKELLMLIDRLNKEPSIHGVLVQLPLPKHINPASVIESIDPSKDVDGFHPFNMGRLMLRKPQLRPCTPKGVITLIESTKIEFRGLNALVVGASNIVGRPMTMELLIKGCTTTCAHRFTKSLATEIKRADILVVGIGKPQIIRGEWIKHGAIVVDVGINRMTNGQVVGDIEFDIACERASWITPVPGGVGPMTVATLIENTLYATEESEKARC